MEPGAATDALVTASVTARERRDGYTVVRCPPNPAFWFGNMLVLDREPPPAEYAELFVRDAADAQIPRAFAEWRFGVVRADARAGRCRMWGAWDDSDRCAALAAFAVLYADERWARFFTPVTAGRFRRRGLLQIAVIAAADAEQRA